MLYTVKSVQMLNSSGFEPFSLLTRKARLSILKREQDGLNLTLGRVISMLLRDTTRTVCNLELMLGGDTKTSSIDIGGKVDEFHNIYINTNEGGRFVVERGDE